jgi:hypothetical protein
MDITDKQIEQGIDWATKVALSKSVEHVTTAVTTNPAMGKVAGQATGAAYSQIPTPVKTGAGIGGFLALHAAAHIGSIGTAGSLAAAGATLAFAPWLIAGGAIVGTAIWLFSD